MRKVTYSGNPEWTVGDKRLSVTLDDDSYDLLEHLAFAYSIPITDVARKLLSIAEHSDFVQAVIKPSD